MRQKKKLKMKQKKNLIMAGIAGFLFLILMIVVQTVDTANIGPMGTVVGLSHLNQAVHEMFGVKMGWFQITNGIGILSLFVGAAIALVGLYQLIKGKSLWKVEPEILALGALYLNTMFFYIIFELVPVNYRPIIMTGADGVEASFPSSHTLLVCVIMGSAMMLLPHFIHRRTLQSGLKAFCVVSIVVMVLGRLICGVHWATDILGGCLLSACLLCLFAAALDWIESKRVQEKEQEEQEEQEETQVEE